MTPSLVALLVALVAATVLLAARRRVRRRESLAALTEIVRQLGFVIGPGSELVSVDGREVRIRLADAVIALPTRRLVEIYLRFEGEQRTWQFRQLVGQAEAEARAPQGSRPGA